MIFCFYSIVVYPWRPHSQDLRLLLEPQRALGHLLGVGGQHYASLANGKQSCTNYFLIPVGSKELEFWSSHCVLRDYLRL